MIDKFIYKFCKDEEVGTKYSLICTLLDKSKEDINFEYSFPHNNSSLREPSRKLIPFEGVFSKKSYNGYISIQFGVPCLVHYDGINCYVEEIISEDVKLIDTFSRSSANDLLVKETIVSLLNDGFFNKDISQFSLDFFN